MQKKILFKSISNTFSNTLTITLSESIEIIIKNTSFYQKYLENDYTLYDRVKCNKNSNKEIVVTNF